VTLEGIDISWAQDTTPHLDALDFVIVKASEGNFQDGKWDQHSAAVRAAKKPLGAYHFARAEWPVPEQVALFLRIAKDADYLALDYERSRHGTLMLEANARAFIKAVQKAGRKIGLYQSEYSPADYPTDAFGADWRWVANYATEPKCRHDVWQYSDSAGRLDRDSYAGTLAQFLACVSDAPKPPEDTTVKFATLYPDAPLSIAAPAGTQLFDFEGHQFATLDTPTHLPVYGKADAHNGRYTVEVLTGRFYADGVKRPTQVVALIPEGTPE
jgi:hypothetical protein